MASTSVFTILCWVQLVIGIFMGIFGIIDRVVIASPLSFFMLPILNGTLVFATGVAGAIIGRQQFMQSSVNLNAVAGLRAINVMCSTIALVAFTLYGIGVGSISSMVDAAETKGNWNTIKVANTDSDTALGIMAMILILALAEMLVGGWLALLNSSSMIMRIGQRLQDQRPIVSGISGAGFQPDEQPIFVQQQPPQVISPPSGLQTAQVQQPLYVVAQPHGTVPMATNQVLMAPGNQQQPKYVMMQAPSGTVPIATNPPPMSQEQPRYVMMQAPPGTVPIATNPPPMSQGNVLVAPSVLGGVTTNQAGQNITTDSPAPQNEDLRVDVRAQST